METRTLPPSGRDFQVYRLVQMQELSTREVAEALGISQTRVCQVVKKVFRFLKEVVPDEEHAPGENARMFIAEMIASERVSNLYGQAMRCFEASQGKVTVERVKIGDRTVVTKKSLGDNKYLHSAAKFALHGRKLPAKTLIEWQEFEEETELEGEELPSDETYPPVEDCSEEALNSEVTVAEEQPEVVAKPLADVAYEAVTAGVDLRKSRDERPVQVVPPPVFKPHGTRQPPPRQVDARREFLSQDLSQAK